MTKLTGVMVTICLAMSLAALGISLYSLRREHRANEVQFPSDVRADGVQLRTTEELLADIERVLGDNPPSPPRSVVEVGELLEFVDPAELPVVYAMLQEQRQQLVDQQR